MRGPAEHRRHVAVHVTGIVQGVGMRPFVYREARAHRIAGWVLNAPDGVHIDAVGSVPDIEAFLEGLRGHAPAAARIDAVSVRDMECPDEPEPGDPRFAILASDADGARTTLVSPDIATCDDCLRELFDPADRRYHYPFINCTNCGPRFTIIRSLPYDRAATSMDAFPMCPECAAEYADPADRRFHAQPDACFACGPHITWREHGRGAAGAPALGTTREESDAIIERCAELLENGGIVAIKGLGGFHLACSAEDDGAVRELRRRKRRSGKPFAIMVRTVRDAQSLCSVDAQECELLAGSIRPIVLLARSDREGGIDLAHDVVRDLPEIGVMLPYTPLQHLIMAACARRGIRALVMTSGNISGEPIETDDDDAWRRLGPIADALLGNDRAILSRYDDSVVRCAGGRVLPVRRARGYAPRPLPLPRVEAGAAAPDLLACGSEQKATLALVRNDPDGSAACFLSQHIGDIERGSTFKAWRDALERLESLFGVDPAALACDAHPSYLSSQWARRHARARGIPLVEVQHHHAHIASVIAESAARGIHNADEPVIGIAFDGTGAGDDGTVWGGEILVADLRGFTRAAHLRPWRLPGGVASIRDARRCAFSLLSRDGLLGHVGAAPLIEMLSEQERSVTATMVERGINSPLTSSMGRFLDACAAILGICGRATYEGEPAIELEAAATRALKRDGGAMPSSATQGLPYAIHHATERDQDAHARPPREAGGRRTPRSERDDPLVLDMESTVLGLLDGIAAGIDPDDLALALHETVAQAAADAARLVSLRTGIRTVALSGGVFMNRLLLTRTAALLESAGMRVLIPTTVPVNDGCIAYGQAAVARAHLARR
ncbi:carbamoyltransferase HypF [Collinsella tanakaei]|nr:carbamoyltransferase HypF [Collinsella tanakaei]